MLATLAPVDPDGSTAVAATLRPNILIVITDDQPSKTMMVMPKTRRWFGREGRAFEQGYVTTPLCCPSRVSIMTGRYAHNHGVRTNVDPTPLDHSTTLEAYLRGSGYKTALFGRYLNRYPFMTAPPNLDSFARMKGIAYYDGEWNVDGVIQQVSQYSTAFIAASAKNFLRVQESIDEQPWLMYLTPSAPHSPTTAQRRYAGTDVPDWEGNPAVFETDERDKPPLVRKMDAPFRIGRNVRSRQLRALRSVDDMVGAVGEELGDLGESQNTLAFYISDNGYGWSHHGIRNKRTPYTESVKVPFYMRWPAMVGPGGVSQDLVANIDIAPTALEAAGVIPTGPPLDGRSLLSGESRRRLLLEFFRSPDKRVFPPWASIRTQRSQYVEYYRRGGIFFREFYRLDRDRWQLTNTLRDRVDGNEPNVRRLHQRLTDLRDCVGEGCP